jgi:N-methylhydantoinase B/oxoprolinase/acetone carboxylase alpha subunit
MKSFVKEVVAIISGDNAEATGQKILRQADSALKTQIASLNGDTISLEDKVEDAQEALRLVRVNNGKLITDRNQYVRNLLDAKNALILSEETLEVHLEKIAFLQEQFDSLDK